MTKYILTGIAIVVFFVLIVATLYAIPLAIAAYGVAIEKSYGWYCRATGGHIERVQWERTAGSRSVCKTDTPAPATP